MAKLIFSSHYSSLQCNMIIQKSADLELFSFFLLLVSKTVVLLNIFMETMIQKKNIYLKYNFVTM